MEISEVASWPDDEIERARLACVRGGDFRNLG